jgi:hypothetical protein
MNGYHFFYDKSVLDKYIKFCYILLKWRGVKMHQIYEFETTISDRGTIKLPKDLLHLKNLKVKLSLIKEESDTQNWLDLIESHAIDDDELPTDYSINLDHYLYGLP